MLHVYGSVIDGFEDLAANVLVAGNGGVAVVGGAGIGDGHIGHVSAEGADEDEAITEVEKFFKENF